MQRTENFYSAELWFLNMIQLSEHNATLNQVRTTYQKKLPETRVKSLLKPVFDLSPTCQMMHTQHCQI